MTDNYPQHTNVALRSGALSLPDHIEALLALLDRTEPRIEALLPEPGRAARLRSEAASLARQWPDPAQRPPLFGITVAVKDNIRVDGLPTRAGSRLPPDLFAGPEGTLVRRLRAKGALILGKAVTTEFTLGHPGPTRNPHDPAHTPGGSSSGSAAAVAAGYCTLAIGTQTGGSVIRPAAYCGVVGFKPSFGRLPADGLVRYSPALDHVGLFAPDLEGLCRAAASLCDGWMPDRTTVAQAGLPVLGIAGENLLAPLEADARRAFEATLSRLAALGYTLRRTDYPRDLASLSAQRRNLALGELAEVHRDWFARYPTHYSDYTAARIRAGQAIPAAQLAELRDTLPDRRHEADIALAQTGADLLVLPAAPGPAPFGLDNTGNSALNQPFTFTGQPALTLPCGTLPGGHLPLGLQIVAPGGQDEALLGWAVGIARALDSG